MKRVRRIIFRTLTVLSLALCAGTCVLGARSYWVGDGLMWRVGYREDKWVWDKFRSLDAGRGVVGYEQSDIRYSLNVVSPSNRQNWSRRWSGVPVRPSYQRFAGAHQMLGSEWMSFFVTNSNYTDRYFRIIVPLWIPLLVFVAIGSYGVRRWNKRGREPNGCVKCSYDLTGNVSGVCPECGKAIVRAA